MAGKEKPTPAEGIAMRLPDKMADRLGILTAQRNQLNLAIAESIGGFLMARGQDLDAIDWQLSDDGRAVMVRPKKPAG